MLPDIAANYKKYENKNDRINDMNVGVNSS